MINLSVLKFVTLTLVILALGSSIVILGINREQGLKSKNSLTNSLSKVQKEIQDLKSEDQYVKNENLQKTIAGIEKTYQNAVKVYEVIDDLKAQGIDTASMQEKFVKSLSLLSERSYADSQTALDEIISEQNKIKSDLAAAEQKKIEDEAKAKAAADVVAKPKITTPAQTTTPRQTTSTETTTSNTPPADGQYSRQIVDVNGQKFTVSIIAANLSTTRVIVDTSFNSECDANCPLWPLAQFASGNGAFAGVNGSYFCPASYPSCVGKENSFEFFAVNKSGTFFNESEIGISSYPAFRFRDSSLEVISSLLYWQRDNSATNIITNYPLLVSNGNIAYTGGDDNIKITQKGNRSFVASIGNMVYIGTVHSVSMTESAQVLDALGMDNALNLDDGGSTALWYDGSYKLGPGRNLPNAILFVKK